MPGTAVTDEFFNEREESKFPILRLSEKSKEMVRRSVGVSFEDLQKMDVEVLEKAIEKKIKKPLRLDFSGKVFPIFGRGSIYLALRRFLKGDVNKEIDKI